MVIGPKPASTWGSEAKQSLLAFGELMGPGENFIESGGGARESHEKQTSAKKENQKAGGISEGTTAMVVWAEGPPSCWGASCLCQHAFLMGEWCTVQDMRAPESCDANSARE